MRKLIALALAAIALLVADPAIAACPPIPALPDTERRTEYTGISGQTGPFNVGFQLYGDGSDYGNWLQVWVNGVQKLPTTDFVVTSPSGPLQNQCLPITNAQVTFTAPQSGTIDILGARRPRRTSQLQENRGVTAHDFNQLTTDIIAAERELFTLFHARTLHTGPPDVISVLPPAAARANMLLGFDATGNVPTMFPIGAGGGGGGVSSIQGMTGALTCGGGMTCSGGVLSSSGTSGAITTDAYFGSGMPWCDPRAYGALGNASHDDYPAFAQCIAKLAATSPAAGQGGMLYIPPGNYCIKSGTIDITPANIPNAINIVGAGRGSVGLNACGADRTVLRMNIGLSTLSNITIMGKGYAGGGGSGSFAAGFTQPALLIDQGCVGCRLTDVTAQGGTYAIFVAAADTYLDGVRANLSYGDALVKVQNTTQPIAVWFIRSAFDTQLPCPNCVGPPAGTTYNAWAPNTVYSVSTIVSLGGYYIQAASVTLDARSGSTAPALDNFAVPIPDNHVTWNLIQQTSYCGLDLNSGAYEISIIASDLSNVYSTAGLCMRNTGGGGAPGFVKVSGGTVISNTTGGADILLQAGSNFSITDSEIVGCPTAGCVGVFVGSAFGGQTRITNNYIQGQVQGVLALANDVVVTSNSFAADQIGTNIGANVSNFTVANNSFASGMTYGVLVNTGTSDHYSVTGNACAGGVGCVVDQGTGTNKSVSSNGNVLIQALTLPPFAGGGNRCLHVDNNGVVSAATSDCGSGSGAVSSITNTDSTLTMTPSTGTGAVVASLNLAHANTWTAAQTMNGLTLSNITGVAANCLHVNTAGVISGTGSDCGSSTGGGISSVGNVDGSLTFNTVTGVVTGSINLAHGNYFTAQQGTNINQNASSVGFVSSNTDPGTGAIAAFQATNGTNVLTLGVTGTGSTDAFRGPSRGFLAANQGMSLNANGAEIKFGLVSAEVGRWSFTTKGELDVGSPAPLAGIVKLYGATSGSTNLQATAAASGLITLPAATDTLVGLSTTDQMSNKTLITPVIAEIDGGTLPASTLTLKTTTNAGPSGDQLIIKRGSTTVLTMCDVGAGIFGIVMGNPMPTCGGGVPIRLFNNGGAGQMIFGYDNAGPGMLINQAFSGGIALFNLQANSQMHFVTKNGGVASQNGFMVGATGCLGIGTTTECGAGNTLGFGWIAPGATPFSSLPICNAASKGARFNLTDAATATPTFLSAVTAGGGTNVVPVFCDGTGPNWKFGANDNQANRAAA